MSSPKQRSERSERGAGPGEKTEPVSRSTARVQRLVDGHTAMRLRAEGLSWRQIGERLGTGHSVARNAAKAVGWLP